MLAAWALGLALAAQTPDPVRALIDEINSLAAGEPPILGIATQVAAGDTLAKKRNDDALAMLDAALARTAGLTEPATRGTLTVQIAKVLANLDASRAEEICATLPKRTKGYGMSDVLAVCSVEVTRKIKEWPEQVAAARRFWSRGAVDSPLADELLNRAKERHPADMVGLYAAFIDALPLDATPAEVDRYLRDILTYGARFPALSRSGLELAYRNVKTPAGYARFIQVAEKMAPDLVETYADRLKRYRDVSPDEQQQEEEKDEDLGPEPNASKLSFEDALALAREQKQPIYKAAILLELLDRDSTPEERRGPLSMEALEATTKVKPGDDRLIGQSMLTRRLWVFGLKEEAGKAASMLEESFELLCRCRDATCDSLKGRQDCAERVMDFAEYLQENDLKAEDLGLTHRSLRVRMLILELDTLLNGKRKKGLF